MAGTSESETQPIASVPELYGSTSVAEDDDPCPMEPDTYKAVFEFRGRDMLAEFPETQFEGRFEQFSPTELMVRQDLAKNKIRWSDDYYQDRRRFLNNMHPVLALFYGHRLHVISHKERWCVYIVQMFFVLLISLTFPFASRCGAGTCETVGEAGVGAGHPCVFPFTYKGETYKTCTTEHYFKSRTGQDHIQGNLWCSSKTASDGQHIEGEWGHCWCHQRKSHEECWKWAGTITEAAEGHRYVHAVLCCLAHYTGVAWFGQTFGMDLGGTLYACFLNTIFSLGSFQLMICGCVQKKSAILRRCGEQTGHVVYALFAILILLPQPYLIMYAREHGLLAPTMFVFLSSKVASYSAITALQVVVFHFIWGIQEPDCLEDTADGEKSPAKPSRECMPDLTKFHVTSAEYEAFMHDRRVRGISKPIVDTCNKFS